MEIKKLVEYGVGGLVSLIIGDTPSTLGKMSYCEWPCHKVCGLRSCECVCPSEPEVPYLNIKNNAENFNGYSVTEPGSDGSTGPTNPSGSSDEPRLFASIVEIEYKK